MIGDGVVVRFGDGANELFELRGLEFNEFVALGALQMMMVWLEGSGQFVAFFPADMDNIDNAELGKELKRTVDAGAVYLSYLLGKLGERERLGGVL